MQIHVRADAVEVHQERTGGAWSVYQDMLRQYADQWIEIDTEQPLYDDVFVTKLRGYGFWLPHIHVVYIDQIQDDVRIGRSRCLWCERMVPLNATVCPYHDLKPSIGLMPFATTETDIEKIAAGLSWHHHFSIQRGRVDNDKFHGFRDGHFLWRDEDYSEPVCEEHSSQGAYGYAARIWPEYRLQYAKDILQALRTQQENA